MALDLEMLMDTQAEGGFPARRWVNMPLFLQLFTSPAASCQLQTVPQSLGLFSFSGTKDMLIVKTQTGIKVFAPYSCKCSLAIRESPNITKVFSPTLVTHHYSESYVDR